MPILNYTTKIDAVKTVGEIQGSLALLGARSVQVEFENREPVAVKFQIEVQGKRLDYRLPARWQGVYKVLSRDAGVERRYRTEEQAKRVAWRIVKDWIEAQMALVQAGVAEAAEVFLPYMLNPETGQTLFENFKGGLQLPAGDQNR